MSLYEQIWNNSQYEPRLQPFLRDLPQNHLLKVKTVNVDQTEYKIYQNLSCFLYERILVRCTNQFGARYYYNNVECHDIDNLFRNCTQLNYVMANLKNTHPEYFAVSHYSRSKPSFSELGL